MEKKALKTSLTLPPNVHGRRRGRLSLCLHEIAWQSDEPFQFNWIQAKLIWWGDKYQSGVALKYDFFSIKFIFKTVTQTMLILYFQIEK